LPADIFPTQAQWVGPIEKPFVVRKVGGEAPWDWLTAGWYDLWRAPTVGFAYGAVFAAVSFILVYGLFLSGLGALILPLTGGFLLVGPLLAVGLYDVSRRLEADETITVRSVVFAGLNARGQLAFLGVLLLIIYFFWVQLAFLLLMLFMGTKPVPPAHEFIPALLFTKEGLGLLVVGTATGAILAAIVFALSAISVPMLYHRKIDVITGIATSVRAVLKNPAPMALWGVIIVALVAFGIATQFIGLILTLPLLGHATWHAYRDVIADEDPH